MEATPWLVSLHGGHSGEFCEHARGTLRQVLEAAESKGFAAYGISEHAPRLESRFLYASERRKGYTVDRLQREFERFAAESRSLQRDFSGRLEVLRGFEAEVVPAAGYAALMRSCREEHGFDYMVGSVHHVLEISIDEHAGKYMEAVAGCGGFEPFLERYYRLVTEMIHELRPEVVAHLDLPRLYAPAGADMAGHRARAAAAAAIEAARSCNCILDLNAAALRKGLSEPYPSAWLVRLASEAGVPFCFGDDSHGPQQVGAGLRRARAYLLAQGVDSIAVLERGPTGLRRRLVPLRTPPSPRS